MPDKRTLSYSAWKTWDLCPAKYRFSYLEKLPRKPPGPAAARGTEIHASVDEYLSKKTEAVHPEISRGYGQWLMQLRELPHKMVPEKRWAVNSDWEPCDYKDPEALWRGFIDLHIPMQEGEVVSDNYEWKTGKVYDDHKYQANLYATVALVLEENAQLARVTNVYFDQNKTTVTEVTREDHEGAKFLWKQRHEELHRDDIFPPNPGWYCRYCDFGRENGGPCTF